MSDYCIYYFYYQWLEKYMIVSASDKDSLTNIPLGKNFALCMMYDVWYGDIRIKIENNYNQKQLRGEEMPNP